MIVIKFYINIITNKCYYQITITLSCLQMTWADIFACCYLSTLSTHNRDCLEAAPKVRNLIHNVTNVPGLKKWLQERPVTAM